MANPRNGRSTGLSAAVGNSISGHIESLRREGSDMASLIELARELDMKASNIKFRMEGIYSELFGPRLSEVRDEGVNAMPNGQINQIAMYLRDVRSTLEQFDELTGVFEDRAGLVPDRGPFVQDSVKTASSRG